MHMYIGCSCILVLLSAGGFSKSIDCPESCKCSLKQSKNHEAVCTGRDLHYIPLFPENIHDVIMNGTNLSYIGENGFDNLTKITLKKLYLNDNLILYIHPHSFTKLVYLGKIYISDEKRLNVDILKTGLRFSTKEKLTDLIFDYNSWSYLPLDMFSNLTRNHVAKLRIKSNTFPEVKCNTFSPLTNLFDTSLSENLIERLDMTGIPGAIRKLHLDNNLLPTVPDWCVQAKRNTSAVQYLVYLDLSYNSIGYIKDDSLGCLPKLEMLVLNGNPIGRIYNNIFTNNPILYTVRISKIGYPLRKIDDFAFNSSSLSNLNMQETNFHFDLGNFNPTSIFSLSPNLTFLYH
ncbi:Hypothetical predicted protein [Mytilus galloprovincialis]|uniref:Uncharacterized protein n=1 Tax=Mytilus galloprovincialis TaxID=29158 RepID=A0A8B6EU28_MYTGA|nr:Hypothetical predicted protein [Mytilus galloprovincialis]